jgi:hypothetical protein
MTSALSLYVQDVHFNAKEELMSMKAIRKAQQITVDELATIAATGVARALDARQAAGIELSSEELSQVNGGATLPPNPSVTVYGGYPIYAVAR